mgnify:CR=1 FL=1
MTVFNLYETDGAGAYYDSSPVFDADGGLWVGQTYHEAWTGEDGLQRITWKGVVPLEVAPLVSSINDLLMRLKDSIATQKRFLADAAHQLKTPLAGLRMQADLAQREGASELELKQSLQHIGRASIRATHTVNQLLSLARAESGGRAGGMSRHLRRNETCCGFRHYLLRARL